MSTPPVCEIFPDPDSPFGWRTGPPQQLPPELTSAKLTLRLCTRVTELSTADMWPALRERNQVRRCTRCHEEVWYDPASTIVDPARETIVCIHCLPDVLEEIAESQGDTPE